MAELVEKSAIVPAGSGYTLTVKDFDAAGKVTELSCPMPDSADFSTWTMMQQIAMLKRGVWKTSTVSDIVWGLAYAQRIGADVMMGELFPTGEGRWGTSNKYKIKKALASGMVTGIESVTRELPDSVELAGCIQKKDLECTVTISVKGWEKPLVRKARLSRWFKGNNPNWKGNPEHMLELNTVAHACEYVPGVTGSTEDDEAPPLPAPETSLEQQLKESIAVAQQKGGK